MARAGRTVPRTASIRTWRTARRWSAEEAQQALHAWDESGVTASEFCRKHKLKVQRIHKWLGRFGIDVDRRDQADIAAREVVNGQPAPVHWVEARVIGTQADLPAQRQGVSAIKVHLATGQVIDVVTPGGLTPEWLARLARELSVA